MSSVFALALLQSLAVHPPAPLPADGIERGIRAADSIIAAAVERTIPGAVFVVARRGKLLHERAFGWAELNDFDGRRLPMPRPMHPTTLFDLASVTKVMATTMAVMKLVGEGRIDVDAPVYRYLPDFRGVHLDSITVRHLLQHSAGLVQWQPLYYHAANERETYQVIRQMPLQWGVGEGRHYSDLGFMLLGYIVEHVTRQPLDRWVVDSIYGPLGLRSTTYLPRKHGFRDFAVTEQGNGYERHMVYDSTFGYRYRGDPTAWNGWRQYVLDGETDDGNSWYANNGVAGHAGLFSTAADLRFLLDLLLSRGAAKGRQYINASVIDQFLTRDRYQNFLGWMSPNGLPEGSFSHTGFTGTYVLGVPKYGLSIVLLTNRQNMGADPRGYFPDVGPLQLAVAKAVVAGAEADAPPADDHRKIDIGGYGLDVVQRGSGTPIAVFESGLGDSLDAWNPVLPAISRLTTTIAYSRAGFGRSDAGPSPLDRSARREVEELHTLLTRLRAPPPYVLVARSYGSILVRLYTSLYPQDVAGLVIVEGTHEQQVRRWGMIDSTYPPAFFKFYDSVLAVTPPGTQAGEIRETVRIQAAGGLEGLTPLPDIPIAVLTSMKSSPTAATVNGRPEGHVVWRELHDEWFRRSRNGLHVETSRSGHGLQEDEPQLVIDAIRFVLERTRSP